MADMNQYARIDAALDRIDAALNRPDPQLEHLRLRHARLRARVEDAVAALDAIAAPPSFAGRGFDDADLESDED